MQSTALDLGILAQNTLWNHECWIFHSLCPWMQRLSAKYRCIRSIRISSDAGQHNETTNTRFPSTASKEKSSQLIKPGDIYSGLPVIGYAPDNPANASAVADAIRVQHWLFFAQYINAIWRLRNTLPQIQNRSSQVPLNNTSTLNATGMNPLARDRIIHDSASTRILHTIFSTTSICITTNWDLMREAFILPRVLRQLQTRWRSSLIQISMTTCRSTLIECRCRIYHHEYLGENARFFFGYRKSPKTGDQVLGIHVTKADTDARNE
ncbi:hypothetical protein F5Y16DRAFT_400534 [Xylariaceae sp. FL0255]|nr:hypothetical protein F5Y16DRAFT_400534 [Xylariaceae sp. FL0255]